MDATIAIPKTEVEITAEWIRQNTALKPVEGSISVEGNVQAGMGFLSNLCRVSFQTEEGSMESIVVKLLPENPDFRSLTIDEKFDQIEVKFYSSVRPEILKVSPELEVNLCKYYGGRYLEGCEDVNEYGSILIMEDLKPMGYHILDPNAENWDSNMKKIMIFLAKLHGAGLAIEAKKNTKISRLFPYCLGVDDSKLTSLVQLAVINGRRLPGFLAKFGCPDEVREAYARISHKTGEIMMKILEKGAETPCLIHGDIWQPNVMVAGEDDPVKIIDWQLLGYRDPTYELTPALLTCIADSALDSDVMDKFARLYYRELASVLEENGLGINAFGRTEKEFMEFYKTWGIGYGYIWTILTLDSFPNNESRLYDIFMLLQEKYNIVEVLS